MSEYRFLPQASATLWWKILLAVGLVLGVPIAVNAALPDTALNRLRPLELSDPYYDWTVPVYRDNGQPWMCTRTESLALGYEFDCGSGAVSTRIVSGIEDMEIALRRELRANRTQAELPDDYLWNREPSSGHAILVDRPTGDVVLASPCKDDKCGNDKCEESKGEGGKGEGDKCKGDYLLAFFPGGDNPALLENTWKELTQDSLPPQISGVVKGMQSGSHAKPYHESELQAV